MNMSTDFHKSVNYKNNSGKYVVTISNARQIPQSG